MNDKASNKYESDLNVNMLLNADGTGIIQQNANLDNTLFNQSYEMLEKWRKEGRSENELSEFYNSIDNQVKKHYSESFGLSID